MRPPGPPPDASGDATHDRRRFQLVAAVMAAVVTVTAVGFFVVVILSAEDSPPSVTAATPTPTATPAGGSAGSEGAALTGPVVLRSGPAADVAIVTRLAETDAIRVLGRSADGEWLVIGSRTRADVTGWVRLDAVTGIDVSTLPVIAAPGATATPSSEGTLTPDLPDLLVAGVYSRDNLLWVTVVNQGAADAPGPFEISVDGDAAVSLEVRPGEPLRAGQELDALVPGQFLQLRRNMTVAIVPREERPEEDAENNTWAGIVGPDVPNDIEILGVEGGQDEDPLVVILRNNSPIPVAGAFTVSVREALPGTELLGRVRVAAEVPTNGTAEIVLDDLTEVDLTRVSIILSTDAIDDGNLANNAYPR